MQHIQLCFGVSTFSLNATGSFIHSTHISKSTQLAQGKARWEYEEEWSWVLLLKSEQNGSHKQRYEKIP